MLKIEPLSHLVVFKLTDSCSWATKLGDLEEWADFPVQGERFAKLFSVFSEIFDIRGRLNDFFVRCERKVKRSPATPY